MTEEVKRLVESLKNSTFGGGESAPSITPVTPSRTPTVSHPSNISTAKRVSNIPSTNPPLRKYRERIERARSGITPTKPQIDPKILDFIQKNPEVKELILAVIGRSEQLQTASSVLEKVEDNLDNALYVLFNEETCENIEKFMDVFEAFAREQGVDEETLLSHFDSNNFLCQVGINCLKDAGVRDPLREFSRFLKSRCLQDGPAFYVYRAVGAALDQGEFPDLDIAQPFTWDDFYDLFTNYIEASGIPEQKVVKNCARCVFEEGIITLKELGICDPVRRFVEFVLGKQLSLKKIWKNTTDIFIHERPSAAEVWPTPTNIVSYVL